MNLLTEQSSFTMIRVEKYRNYFISKCISYLLISLLFVLCALITLSMVGLGLPLRNEYTETLNYPMIIGSSLSDLYKTPLMLVLAQSLQLILGFTFLSIISEVIYIFFKNKTILLLALGTSYVFTVFHVSGKLDVDLSKFLISTYTTLRNTPNYFITTIVTEVIVVFFLLYIVSHFWHKKVDFETFKDTLFDNWNMKNLLNKRFLLVSFILLTIVNITLYLNADLTNFSDFIYLPLSGYGYGYFNTLTFSAL